MTLAALATVFAVSAFVPAVAFGQGNIVNDVLKGVQGILGGGGGATDDGGGSAEPQAGVPPNYTPPLHGGNPHGEGSVGTVDLTPTNDLPLPDMFPDGQEDVVIGDSRGEQDADGNYHGRVTLLHANLLGVINTDTLGLSDLFTIQTEEGETKSSPLDPLNDALDMTVCPLLGGAGCINIVSMESDTGPNHSFNSYETLGTSIEVPGLLNLQSSTASSSGDISDDGSCQTATGESSAEDASVGLLTLPAVTATALEGSSESTACNNGTQTVTQDSEVLGINEQQFGLNQECADGVPNSSFLPGGLQLLPVVGLVCNANDENNGQTSAPYGVREALTVFALVLGDPVIKATTAGPESHAVAPGVDEPPPTTPETPPAGGDDGGDDDDGPGGPGKGGEGAGPAAGDAQAGDDDLAFTGTNMLVLGLIGTMLIAGGLGLARASTRRHRRLAA